MKTRKEWTKEEIKFLKENNKSMTSREIAKLLDRGNDSIKHKRRKLNFMKGPKEIKNRLKKHKLNKYIQKIEALERCYI